MGHEIVGFASSQLIYAIAGNTEVHDKFAGLRLHHYDTSSRSVFIRHAVILRVTVRSDPRRNMCVQQLLCRLLVCSIHCLLFGNSAVWLSTVCLCSIGSVALIAL